MRKALIILVSMILAEPAMAQALLRERWDLTEAGRLDLAEQARKACQAQGYDVAVAIVDRDGTLRTLLSGDAASALSVDAAIRKAHTAAVTGMATSVLAPLGKQAPDFAALLATSQPGLVALGGGLPVMVRGRIAGAIGVGGAPRPEADEACARAALAALPV
jgi:uncharacterized protein GlcG (DUF336 family)